MRLSKPAAGAHSRSQTHARVCAGILSGTLVVGCNDAHSDPGSTLTPVASSIVAGRTATVTLSLTDWQLDEANAALDSDTWGPFAPCQTPLPRVEDSLVEFDTAVCSAYTVQTMLPEAIVAGSIIEFALSHTVLLADQPTSGRMLLRLDDEEFDRWVAPIPGPADARTTHWSVSSDIPAGTRLGVHVSNHGTNNWRLVSVRVFPPI